MGKQLRRSLSGRRLKAETLEKRMLLAGDVAWAHNFEMPEDVDGNGVLTSIDALAVLNRINAGSEGNATTMPDVDADGKLTPVDALVILNGIEGRNGRSRVAVESRIERLENALESGNLPGRFSVERTEEILNTLRAGGLPEMGDRFQRGTLLRADEVSSEALPVGTDPSAADLQDGRPANIEVPTDPDPDPVVLDPDVPTDPDPDPVVLDPDVPTDPDPVDPDPVDPDPVDPDPVDPDPVDPDPVDPDPVDPDPVDPDPVDPDPVDPDPVDPDPVDPDPEPVDETGGDEHCPMHGEDGRWRPHNRGGHSVEHFSSERLAEKLSDLGVEPSVIETLVAEIDAAIETEEPLTRRHIHDRLEELGVDLTQLRGERTGSGMLNTDRLADKLEELGGSAGAIMSLVEDIVAGFESEMPLSREEIRTRIEELGVDLDELRDNRPRYRFGSPRHGFFARFR